MGFKTLSRKIIASALDGCAVVIDYASVDLRQENLLVMGFCHNTILYRREPSQALPCLVQTV